LRTAEPSTPELRTAEPSTPELRTAEHGTPKPSPGGLPMTFVLPKSV
jgi:hypothetical protein